MASTWTQELKDKAVELYTGANPTAENTMDIVATVAEEIEQTVNGTRLILTTAGVYIPKAKAKAAATGDKPKRKSKQESLDELTAILEEHSVEIDDTIIPKLTGKAADYFTAAFKQIIEG